MKKDAKNVPVVAGLSVADFQNCVTYNNSIPVELLDQFSDHLCWTCVSSFQKLTFEFCQKYAQKIYWDAFIFSDNFLLSTEEILKSMSYIAKQVHPKDFDSFLESYPIVLDRSRLLEAYQMQKLLL